MHLQPSTSCRFQALDVRTAAARSHNMGTNTKGLFTTDKKCSPLAGGVVESTKRVKPK